MKEKSQITVLILENRQMIAAILADLLEGTGYRTRLVAGIAEAQEALPHCLPAVLLADLGMIPPDQSAEWAALQQEATSLSVPMLFFSCSPLPDAPDVLVLRSPGDFAAVIGKVEEEWHRKQPFLGMTLIEMELLPKEDLEALLRVQRELAQIGRHYVLGDLLVRLGIVSQEEVEQALQKQEP